MSARRRRPARRDSAATSPKDTAAALAAYKAAVDKKYNNLPTLKDALAAREEADAKKLGTTRAQMRRKDDWLLISPAGEVVGLVARWSCPSAVAAFEEFFPTKKERHARAAEGYRIEQDDEDGTRVAAYADTCKARLDARKSAEQATPADHT